MYEFALQYQLPIFVVINVLVFGVVFHVDRAFPAAFAILEISLVFFYHPVPQFGGLEIHEFHSFTVGNPPDKFSLILNSVFIVDYEVIIVVKIHVIYVLYIHDR